MKDLFTTVAQSRAIINAGAPAPEHPFGTWAIYYNGDEYLYTGNDRGHGAINHVPAFSINDLIELIGVPVLYITKAHEYNVSTIEMHYTMPDGSHSEWIGDASGPSLIDCLVRVAIQYFEFQKQLNNQHS